MRTNAPSLKSAQQNTAQKIGRRFVCRARRNLEFYQNLDRREADPGVERRLACLAGGRGVKHNIRPPTDREGDLTGYFVLLAFVLRVGGETRRPVAKQMCLSCPGSAVRPAAPIAKLWWTRFCRIPIFAKRCEWLRLKLRVAAILADTLGYPFLTD